MSKRALVVGINEFDPDPRSKIPVLRGCVNDAEVMAAHLTADFDFPASQVRVLLDEEATGERLRTELGWLFSDYEGGGPHLRLLHISSHGTQVPVLQGDDGEHEAMDEAFVVHDHQYGQPFRDNEIRQLIDTVPDDVTVIFHADCCHSGDLAALEITEEGELERAVPGRSSAEVFAWLRRRRELARIAEGVPVPTDIAEVGDTRFVDLYHETYERALERSRSSSSPAGGPAPVSPQAGDFGIVEKKNARYILISACEDYQESKEFRSATGGWHGGLTWAVSKTIKKVKQEHGGDLSQLSYGKLIEEVGKSLKFSAQRPLLECPENLLDTPIFAAAKGKSSNALSISKQQHGDQIEMADKDKTTTDPVLLFLMEYVSAPRRWDKVGREKLMKKCGLDPMLIAAMTSKWNKKDIDEKFNAVSMAMSESVKPIDEVGGGT